MEACDGGDMGFQRGCNAVTNCDSNPVSQEASSVATSSMIMMPKPPNMHHDPFFSSGWDSFSSMTQNHQSFGCPPAVPHQDYENFTFPPVPLWENQGITPHLAQYLPTNSSFAETVPRPPCFMNQGLPNGLPQYGPIPISEPNYASNVEGGAIEGTQNREVEAMSSPSTERRRKRTPESSSPCDPNKVTSVASN